jgi:HlyD family secretion protein
MKKWIVILLLIAGAGAYGYKQWPAWKAKAQAPGEISRPTTAVAERRTIRFSVPAAGEITPAEQVSVRPEVNGLIDRLPVDIGDEVKKGEMLFTLDDKQLKNEQAANITEIERAKLQVEQAERNYKRAQELFHNNLIAQELYENAKTEFDLAKNALERAQRQLAITEESLKKLKINAPFDCTILTRPVSIGQAVSGSGGFNSGTEVLTIADLHNLIINAHINQADITRLRQDQEVEVSVEAVPGLVVTGKVERIAPQATIKNNIKGFAVRILLKDVDKRIRPGMTANIKIPVAFADDVVAVPLPAVFTERDPDTLATERYVYVKNGENAERRKITIGVADFFYAEVQSGLEPGDVVMIEPPKEELERVAKQNKDKMAAGFNQSRGSGENRQGQPRPGGTQPSTGSAKPGSQPVAQPRPQQKT